jgi:hypothetical protein
MNPAAGRRRVRRPAHRGSSRTNGRPVRAGDLHRLRTLGRATPHDIAPEIQASIQGIGILEIPSRKTESSGQLRRLIKE